MQFAINAQMPNFVSLFLPDGLQILNARMLRIGGDRLVTIYEDVTGSNSRMRVLMRPFLKRTQFIVA